LKRPNRNIGNEKLKKSNKDPVESFNNRWDKAEQKHQHLKISPMKYHIQ
jgi:hypothetical protein